MKTASASRGPGPDVLALLNAISARLYEQSRGSQWGLTIEQFSAALAASVAHAFPNKTPAAGDLDRYFASLHLGDLALASACTAGLEPAWDHFMREHRPSLYRAADAIDPSGGARDLADALYADLFGLRERDGVRLSLFRYFHGRSRLTTWLRAVLAQRHIDRIRAERRHEPLPDEDAAGAIAQPDAAPPSADRPRFLVAMRGALETVIASLAARDRLRLRCYYSQDLTLAAIGRLLGEHEGTVSRHLTRTRRAVREAVEVHLKREHGFDEATIAECFSAIVADPGSMDLAQLLGADAERKIDGWDRSK